MIYSQPQTRNPQFKRSHRLLHSLSSFQKNKRTALKLRFDAPVMRIFHSTLKDIGNSLHQTQPDADPKEQRPRFRRSIDTLSLQSYRDLIPKKFLEDIDKTWRSAIDFQKGILSQQANPDDHGIKSLHNLGEFENFSDPDQSDQNNLIKDLECVNCKEVKEKRSSSDDSLKGLEESKGWLFASAKEPTYFNGPKRKSLQMHPSAKEIKGSSSNIIMMSESERPGFSLKKNSFEPISKGNSHKNTKGGSIITQETKRKGFLSRKTIVEAKEPKVTTNETMITAPNEKIVLSKPLFCCWDFDVIGNYQKYFKNGNCKAVLSRMRVKSEWQIGHRKSASPCGGMSPAAKRKKLRQSLKHLSFLPE